MIEIEKNPFDINSLYKHVSAMKGLAICIYKHATSTTFKLCNVDDSDV